MSGKIITHPGMERRMDKGKAELVLELIKGHKTIVEAAREHDLKQIEIQR